MSSEEQSYAARSVRAGTDSWRVDGRLRARPERRFVRPSSPGRQSGRGATLHDPSEPVPVAWVRERTKEDPEGNLSDSGIGP